ncbi:hypothetical protein GmHk_01G001869 [Glycine max]|nr:hypothetical protein GmHk_01G001869 [Glycine max]
MLTTSVHRQRQQAHVVEDPPMAAEELNEEQQQPPIEEGVTNVKGFPRMESFHLPDEEVTITLDDMASLLHLPIVRAFHTFELLYVDDIVDMLVELLESGTYAWGTVTLVHMYDNLNEASKSTVRQLARYITLLQALPVSTYRRRLDKLTPDVVYWIPNGDHRSFREFEVISLFSGHLRWGPLTVIHRPKKVVRQFGYIQTIPPHLVVPSASVEEMDAKWMQFDVHQQPVAAGAPNEVDVNVHRPGHVVDGYVAIVDKLERLLNLRIPTEGIKPCIVVEKCLSIARSYIGQPTIGQRSRHR